MKSRRKLIRTVAVIIVALVAYGVNQLRGGGQGEQAVLDAIRSQKSGVMVEFDAPIVKLLTDDNDGARHQRFLVELSTGDTLLIAHNIDLARRVPVVEGEAARVRGQYEWNDRGGVVHWTHHDPGGRRAGGWIEHAGRRYE